MSKSCKLFFPLLIVLISACSGGETSPTLTSDLAHKNEPTQTPTRSQPWVEEEIVFDFGPNELFGILTKPGGDGSFPAIALISGSVNSATGMRAGASSRYFIDHARRLAQNGFAVLRYDPPGVGRSSGEVGFEPLDG